MTLNPVSKNPDPEELTVHIQQLGHGTGLPLPSYGTQQSAGLDLYAAIDGDISIASGTWQTISTGIAIALPSGYEGQIRSRSGLAAKHGINVLNAPGTIDADFRGEIKVILMNQGKDPFIVTRGMRFAQIVIARFTRISWTETNNFDETGRGIQGFGSTGII
jgi:dUTP pyrophosphatase